LGTAFAGQIAHTHHSGTKSLTFTENLTFIKLKKRRKLKIVQNANYSCAYVSKMAVLIIFLVILRTVSNIVMLSIGGQGAEVDKQVMQCLVHLLTESQKMLMLVTGAKQ